MKKMGLIVNPVAGMGGSVGLKGTDGKMYSVAIELGAKPVTQERARVFLSHIKHKNDLSTLVAPGNMGENVAKDANVNFSVVSSLPSEITSADDTKRIAREMMSRDIDLLVFVGGDGTARDTYDAIGLEKPVIGVPSNISIVEKDVFDINEEAYREGKLDIKLYGYLKVPETMGLVQSGKEPIRPTKSSQENHAVIARYIVESMDGDTLYLLGAGTTTSAIADELGG